MSERTYCEAGVHYASATRAQDIPHGMENVRYYWKHKPTGRTGSHCVQLWNKGDIHRLIGHWNGYTAEGGEWAYSAFPFDFSS